MNAFPPFVAPFEYDRNAGKGVRPAIYDGMGRQVLALFGDLPGEPSDRIGLRIAELMNADCAEPQPPGAPGEG